jgi:glycosyltransferase involved in cell wall biosynthesis
VHTCVVVSVWAIISRVNLSVVVTNYNYGRFLGRCLRSLVGQTCSKDEYEIIVVDDASTDRSVGVLETFSNSIRTVFNQTNRGLAYSANIGMSYARGRYVVRVDADDYVHADFIRTLLLGYEFFGSEIEAISTDYLKVTPEGSYLEYGNAEEKPIACAIAFKMDALETLGFYDNSLRINEEIDLRKRFQEYEFRIRNLNLPLYRYVQHSESLSKSVLI